jgi:cytochrome c oxidase subunit 3
MNNSSSVFEQEVREKNQKLLLYLAIGSMIMMFTGLTSAYIVSMGRASAWLQFDLPVSFWFSTAVILCSSYSMQMAVSYGRRQETAKTRLMLNMTLVLGLAFGVLQFFGWQELINNRIFFAGRQSNAAGSYVYVITGLHLLHLAGGHRAQSYRFAFAPPTGIFWIYCGCIFSFSSCLLAKNRHKPAGILKRTLLREKSFYFYAPKN